MKVTDETAVPDAREVFNDADLKRFSLLIEERGALKASIKEYEQKVKELDPIITEMLTDAGTAKVQYGDSKVTLAQGSRSALSKERLLELGVPSRTIAEATTHTAYTYLLVTTAK